MDDMVSAARCDEKHLSRSEDVKQIKFLLRNLQPKTDNRALLLAATCYVFQENNKGNVYFVSEKKTLKRKQLTSPPHFHEAIIFSVNAPSEWCSLNVLILGVNLEANESLHKC